jgi:hypothetical protein
MAFLVKCLFYASVALAATGWWKSSALPDAKNVVASVNDEPLQTPTQLPDFKVQAGGVEYRIKPLFDYEISGVVVSKHNADTWWDWIKKASNDHLNVTDLCVVWGANATSGVSDKVSFSSGQWTCNFETSSREVFESFDLTKISNNHLLTNDAAIAKVLTQARVGDQVFIKGQLAEYRHSAGFEFFRGTSTVRTDGGNGACETIFVREARVLKAGGERWRAAYWAGIVGLVLAVLAWLVLPARLD